MTANKKNEYYIVLMHKMKEAHEHKFYLESSWFAFAILEDRLVSALRQSGGATYANNKPIRMLGPKMEEIKKRKKTDQLLGAYFSDDLWDQVNKWKDDRNDLMHAMADGTQSIEDILQAAKQQSTGALTLVNSVCSAARLLKKHRDKVPVK